MKRNREILFCHLEKHKARRCNTQHCLYMRSITFTLSHCIQGEQREDGRPFLLQMDDDGYRWIKAEDAGVTAGYGHYHMLLSL